MCGRFSASSIDLASTSAVSPAQLAEHDGRGRFEVVEAIGTGSRTAPRPEWRRQRREPAASACRGREQASDARSAGGRVPLLMRLHPSCSVVLRQLVACRPPVSARLSQSSTGCHPAGRARASAAPSARRSCRRATAAVLSRAAPRTPAAARAAPRTRRRSPGGTAPDGSPAPGCAPGRVALALPVGRRRRVITPLQEQRVSQIVIAKGQIGLSSITRRNAASDSPQPPELAVTTPTLLRACGLRD